MTPDGSATEFTGGVTDGFPANVVPAGITTGPDGNIYFLGVSNPGHVFRVTPSGAFTEVATGGVTPGLSADGAPVGIVAGPDGELWFTEQRNNGRVARMTIDGQVSEFVAGLTPGFPPGDVPRQIAVGPDGNVWVSAAGNNSRILRFTPAGVVTEFLGGVTPGLRKLGGPAHMTPGPDGNLWFAAPIDPGSVGYITVGPRVITGAASSVQPAAATLNGSVRPNGQTTVFRFDYGTTDAYGSQTADTPVAAGVDTLPVSATPTGLQPSTTYHYRLVATNDSATTLGEDATFTTSATPPPPVVAGTAAASDLRLTPTSFAAASSGPSALNARRRVGARVTFSLTLAASVGFTVHRRASGRRVGKRCVAPSKRTRKARACTRFVRVRGSFTRSGHSGTNAFKFRGRVGGRTLRPARYRLTATPSLAGKPGKATRAGFRIVR
jgi:streptogramin lyase